MVTLTDIILIMILNVMMYGLFKLMKADITITYKQEFSEEDRQLLEDLYNNEGDPKSEYDMKDAFDAVVRTVNDIMLDNNEEA